MSAAAAEPAVAPKKKLSKKLLVIIVAVVLLLVIAGGAAMFLLKKKPAEADAEGEEDAPVAAAKHHDDKKVPPVFVPLDPFTVNLADHESERYAQIAVTLEVADAHAGDEIKSYLPSIRNGVLMILAHKTSSELLDRVGKEKLAKEIAREAARSMGYEVAEPEPEAAEPEAAADDEEDSAAAKKKKKKKKAKHTAEPDTGPIKRVLFANIIIQ